jgi:hypothetical protein
MEEYFMDKEKKEDVKENIDQDLQKSLDDNLEQMNNLLKSKKSLSKEEVDEMMKNPKNKSLFKEYMKSDKEEKDEDDDEENEDGEKMKKSFDDIYEDHNEVIDAVPVLKSFSKILETLAKRTLKIETAFNNLQKSFEDNLELQKSFGSVIATQSELLKSMNDEIEIIGNTPNKVKGKIDQKDLFKSKLDDDNQVQSKVVGANVTKIKDVLLKSFQEGKIGSTKIARWEQQGYDLSVFNKEELSEIESKL